jgi:SAM-dependent methyltransferase
MVEDAYIGNLIHPDNDSPLEMVGRKGHHDLDWFSAYIGGLLDLEQSDEVLDLCCGNGLITVRVAKMARRVTGVDFSRVLLQQAHGISNAANITYVEGDALSLDSVLKGCSFNKAYISAAFQYFDARLGKDVLSGLRRILNLEARVAILDVPDRSRKGTYLLRAASRLLLPERALALEKRQDKRFPTIRSRLSYLKRHAGAAMGLDGGVQWGWWWSRAAFEQLAAECGFACTVFDQPPQNPHHSYRFDAVLRPIAD